MTGQTQMVTVSEDLGGEPLVKPGQQPPETKLPNPQAANSPARSGVAPGQQNIQPSLANPNPVSARLTTAWEDYMVNGFRNNEEMFKRTLAAFMRPYYITVGMYVALFIIGSVFFAVAVYLGLNDPQSAVAMVFGGLSIASFLAFFIRQPVQALEENLEFISWLGVAFNTYWTRLMFMQDQDTIQADLQAATADYSNTVERLINRHAELRGKRAGGEQTAAQQGASTATNPGQLPTEKQPPPEKP